MPPTTQRPVTEAGRYALLAAGWTTLLAEQGREGAAVYWLWGLALCRPPRRLRRRTGGRKVKGFG